MRGRITFSGNPWPGGHALKKLELSGFLAAERGLSLRLELDSVDYDADEPDVDRGDDADEDDGDGAWWTSRIAWNTYHAAHIGPSMTSDSDGIAVVGAFDVDADGHHFVVDALPRTASEVFQSGAFGCYILGHDAVAGHDIRLERTGHGRFRVRWTGKVAEAYVGKEDFEHDFIVDAEDVAFVGITLWGFDDVAEATAALSAHVKDVDRYIVEREESAWVARLKK